MNVQKFMAKEDYTIISFSFALIQEIELLIEQKELIYKNQVRRYMNNRIDTFIKALNLKPATKVIYSSQIHELIDHRVNKLLNQNNFFQII